MSWVQIQRGTCAECHSSSLSLDIRCCWPGVKGIFPNSIWYTTHQHSDSDQLWFTGNYIVLQVNNLIVCRTQSMLSDENCVFLMVYWSKTHTLWQWVYWFESSSGTLVFPSSCLSLLSVVNSVHIHYDSCALKAISSIYLKTMWSDPSYCHTLLLSLHW